MTIADRIRIRRNELNLSQSEVAQRAGYTDKTSISKFENAGNNITMKQVKRLAKALDTTSAYLMGWNTTEQKSEQEQEEQAKLIYEMNKHLPEEKAKFIVEIYKNIPSESLEDPETAKQIMELLNLALQVKPEARVGLLQTLKSLLS